MNKPAQTAPRSKKLKPSTAAKLIPSQKYAASSFSDKIPLIRSLILDSVKPGVIKKIYLFGSYAYGKPTKNSDIDLCVIIENKFNRTYQHMKMALNLYNNDIIPADLLVYKEKIFYNIKNPNSIENAILTKGILLYG